jgi:flagellar biosynthetic protein FliR
LVALFLITILAQPGAWKAAHIVGTVAPLTPASFLLESLIGILLGLGAAMLIGAAQIAGDTAALQVGLGGSATVDPVTGDVTPVTSQWFAMLILTLWLTGDGHVLLLEDVVESFAAIPPGAEVVTLDRLPAAVAAAGGMFALGLKMAMPFVVTGIISTLALGVLSRAAPALNLFSFGLPLQLMIGGFVALVLAPVLPVVLDAVRSAWVVQLGELGLRLSSPNP